MIKAILRFFVGFAIGCIYTYLIWVGACHVIMGNSLFGAIVLAIGVGLAVGWWAYIWEHTEPVEVRKWKK